MAPFNATHIVSICSIFIALGGCWQEASYCTKDVDCFQGEICENQQCISTETNKDMSKKDMASTDMSADQDILEDMDKRDQQTCPAQAPTLCQMQCVDTQTNVEHCGKCQNPCQKSDGVLDVQCKAAQCVIAKCDEGYRLCENDTKCCQAPECVETLMPIAKVRIKEDGPWADEVEIKFNPNQSTIYLDASQSGPPMTYFQRKWTLERPRRSQAEIKPSQSAKTPTLTVDRPGKYIATLQLYDRDNIPSCMVSSVTIQVRN